MKNVDFIVTAKHYAEREGAVSVRNRIEKMIKRIGSKQGTMISTQLNKLSARAVNARIELGQWIADCECGGCEFVEPNEPIFFCFSCANREDVGMLRPVAFPEAELRAEIESLILARPVNDLRGLDDLERAHMAKPLIVSETPEGAVIPLTRTWSHGESLENLRSENLVIDLYLQALNETPVVEEITQEPTEGEA